MSRASDAWYVRFPDGRVMSASSTAAVRHHLETGRIPADSRVRRAPDEEWVALDWTTEFANLVPKRPGRSAGTRPASSRETAASMSESPVGGLRHNTLRLKTVGVRGLAEELLAAMDSALVRVKLGIAALTGCLGGVCVFAAGELTRALANAAWLPWLVCGLILFLLGAVCSAVLTQMTFVEVSRLRPARRVETMANLGRNVVRLVTAQLLVGGTAVAALVCLHTLPSWVIGPNPDEALVAADWLAGALTAVALVLQVLLWPLLGFALLLGPIIVIDECSVAVALSQWGALVRRHPSRVFLYEALAAALAGVAALPFLIPVALAIGTPPITETANVLPHASLMVLTGLALTPLIAYLIVANVFIFLNLRYEHTLFRS
jgi:hypothetical protein